MSHFKTQKPSSFPVLGTLLFLAVVGRAQSQVNTCAQYYTVGTGTSPSYNVETNYWNMSNSGQCPAPVATQCVNINTTNGDFSVTTSGNFHCGDNVATYPAIYYGCHFGNCSSGTNLPMPVSLLQCVRSSWTISSPHNPGDLWDAAYDIWFGASTNTSSHSAELMIWLDYMPGTGPAGSLKASNFPIAGHNWNVYEGPVGGWTYIAYLATSPIASFDNTDILAFINDCVARGYINTAWYLHAIEAGNEFRTGGVPFSSSGFSALVNAVNCGTSTPTSTPTPAYTPTPCGWPSDTCTPTATFTPTNTSTPTPTPYPNNDVAWPNPWDGSQPVSFYHTLSTPAESVRLKLYTSAFRKIYEDDSLETGKNQPNNWQTAYSLSWDKLGGVANGLYYVVLEEWRGGNMTRSIVKLIILR